MNEKPEILNGYRKRWWYKPACWAMKFIESTWFAMAILASFIAVVAMLGFVLVACYVGARLLLRLL